MEKTSFEELVKNTQRLSKKVDANHKETKGALAKMSAWGLTLGDKITGALGDLKLGMSKMAAWSLTNHHEEMAAIKDNGSKLAKLGSDLQDIGQKVDDVDKGVKVVDQKVDKISKKLNVRDMDRWDIFFGVASGLAFAALVVFLLRGLPESMAIIHDAYGQTTGIDMERCRHIWIIIGLLGGFVGIFIGSCVAQWNCKRRG